jgi:hypothetical protein
LVCSKVFIGRYNAQIVTAPKYYLCTYTEMPSKNLCVFKRINGFVPFSTKNFLGNE